MKCTWVVLFLIASDVVKPLPSEGTPRLEQRSDLDAPFRRAGVAGTTVVYDSRYGRWVTNDVRRAAKRFPPASTFKIFNSLVALETGAIPDTETVLKWDGVPRWVRAWTATWTCAKRSASRRSGTTRSWLAASGANRCRSGWIVPDTAIAGSATISTPSGSTVPSKCPLSSR